MSRKKNAGDPVNGILILDKPAGLTSNAALQEVKRLIGARKAGHTGSLDPIATGLLPICFGDATKLSSFFLEADKRYVTRIRLGVTTETGDSEGKTLSTRPVVTETDQVRQCLEQFRGTIEQIPPMYSALKHQGQPLYKLARQGIVVPREPRRVTVHDISLKAMESPDIVVEVHCSSGFYVRSLAHDLGELLNCGGHVVALRRTTVGDFGDADMVSIDKLASLSGSLERRQFVRAPDRGLTHIPQVNLSVDAAYYLCRGQPVSAVLPIDASVDASVDVNASTNEGANNGTSEPVTTPNGPTTGWVRLYSEGTGFLGMGTILEDGRVAPKRLFLLS